MSLLNPAIETELEFALEFDHARRHERTVGLSGANRERGPHSCRVGSTYFLPLLDVGSWVRKCFTFLRAVSRRLVTASVTHARLVLPRSAAGIA